MEPIYTSPVAYIGIPIHSLIGYEGLGKEGKFQFEKKNDYYNITFNIRQVGKIPAEIIKTSKTLDENRAIDLLLLVEEQSRLKKTNNLDFSDLAEDNADPHYIVNHYFEKKQSGTYASTILMTNNLYSNDKEKNSITVIMQDNDLLTRIKDENQSATDKLIKDKQLHYLIALKNSEEQWDVVAYKSDGLHPVIQDINLDKAINLLSAVEHGKDCAPIKSIRSAHHHYTNVQLPSPKAEISAAFKENIKVETLASKNLGIFNFNQN